MMNVLTKQWHDVTCNVQLNICQVCQLESKDHFQLRGLSPCQTVEQHYDLVGDDFHGLNGDFYLTWNASKNEWKLGSFAKHNMFATCSESRYLDIFTKTCKWKFVNVECPSDERYLRFNRCSKDEFNCHDGTW